MNGSAELTSELVSEVSRQVLEMASISNQRKLAYDILMCPPAPYLQQAISLADSQPVSIGAQNVHAEPSGAFTGEISLPMLAELGCNYVLLGHSERRELFAETDQVVAQKFAACVASDAAITPILCVGELLSDRQAGETENVIAAQLDAVLEATGIEGFADAIVAYEPVWAIGTGETASPAQAQAVHAFIRAKLAKLDENIAADLRILYGGSVKASNALELFGQADIDGGLIGGASLEVESFTGICEAAEKLTS